MRHHHDPMSELQECNLSGGNAELVIAPRPGAVSVRHELAFDCRGRSQAIDVTHLEAAHLVVRCDPPRRLALASMVESDTWHVVAEAQLWAPLTTLRVPAEARIIQVRLQDHVRRPPVAHVCGRIEGA